MRTEVATGAEQARQKALFQLGAADTTGVGADIERRHHLAGGVVNRYGNRAQALFQFLIDNAPALLPHLLQAFEQSVRGVDSAAGLGNEFGVVEVLT